MRATICAVAACILCVAATLVAAPQFPQAISKPVQATSDQSVWHLDLHAVGYPDEPFQVQLRRNLAFFNTLDFVSADALLASFITQEPTRVSAQGDTFAAASYRLHAILLDALTGKVTNQQEWLLHSPDAGIFPRHAGGFVFFSTEQIIIYSPDWKALKRLPISQLPVGKSAFVGLAESPSAKWLMLRLYAHQAFVCVRISTETLEFSPLTCEKDAAFSVSDDSLAELAAAPQEGTTPPAPATADAELRFPFTSDKLKGIFVHHADGTATALCETQSKAIGCLLPQFVNNETIVTYATSGISVLSATGNVAFKQRLDAHGSWIEPGGRPVRPAANGERFAVAFDTSLVQLGSGNYYQLPERDVPATFPDMVQVFDLRQNQWAYTLKNKKNQFKEIIGLALSPAGDKLAIDSGGGIIQLYTVPLPPWTPARN